MEKENLKLVLIDHQQIFRKGLDRVLQMEDEFTVLASSDDYSIVSTLLALDRIDILLIDINIFMHNKSLIQTELFLQSPDTKIIVLSTESQGKYITEAIKFGVHGFLLKEMAAYAFIDAIKAVDQGVIYIHPEATHELLVDYRKLTKTNGAVCEITRPTHLYTKRECEVLQLLTDGKSNLEIAKTLNISDKTVKNHISNLFKKMNVNDRTKAVVKAIRNNWVRI